MLYAGLDLSRKRLDFHLHGLSEHLARRGEPIRAAIESMNGARFVHDTLELYGWQIEIADAQKVKGLAPLARKTDRIDAWVLAELARRDLVPAIWLPDPVGFVNSVGLQETTDLQVEPKFWHPTGKNVVERPRSARDSAGSSSAPRIEPAKRVRPDALDGGACVCVGCCLTSAANCRRMPLVPGRG
jgi:hypothetical protein